MPINPVCLAAHLTKPSPTLRSLLEVILLFLCSHPSEGVKGCQRHYPSHHFLICHFRILLSFNFLPPQLPLPVLQFPSLNSWSKHSLTPTHTAFSSPAFLPLLLPLHVHGHGLSTVHLSLLGTISHSPSPRPVITMTIITNAASSGLQTEEVLIFVTT